MRERGLGEGRVFASVKEMIPHVDVLAIFSPNFSRIETVKEIVEAVKAGARLKGLICEKPLARNLAEARQMIELVKQSQSADRLLREPDPHEVRHVAANAVAPRDGSDGAARC